MNIRKINHTFYATPRKRSQTDTIVIHHSAGHDASAEEINIMHKRRTPPFLGIGYHFVIRAGGAIEEGRPVDTVGAHAGPTINGKSIGICLTGHFDRKPPTAAQINSLVWLVTKHIFPLYGESLKITGHKEHMATSCPGRLFPMAEVQKRIKAGGPNVGELHINGRKVESMVKVVKGRTYAQLRGEDGPAWVEIRALADLLGAKLAWDNTAKIARLTI